MPRDLPQYTRCAAPGVAHEFSIPGALLTFAALGVLGYFLAAGLTCGQVITGIALGLFAALDNFQYWFYNERLMCIRSDQCVAGTVTTKPRVACDGDNKIDTLIAPFGFQGVDSALLIDAINALVASGTIPGPTTDVNDRNNRVAYVNGLNSDQQRLLYMELVHNHMLNDPNRNFLGHFFRRENPPVMPQDAFDNTPDDSPGDASHNPMFRFETDPFDTNFFVTFFCQSILGVPDDEPKVGRLVPYMHCEMEGDRLARALTNLKISIAAFVAAYIAACAICTALTAGAGTLLCSVIAGAIAALFAWLAWLLSKLFNDPDDGTVNNIPVNEPDPTGPNNTTSGEGGDVVLIFGDWVKDTEHNQYFEIHPIKAWYLICRDPDGATVTSDRPDLPHCTFDVRTFTRDDLNRMCGMVSESEKNDPPGTHTQDGPGALSVVGGLR